ncbi:MAG: mercuric ion binding protein [Crocinitomicaceae bacterium]|jgi:mercuric ion binding protein
MKKYIVLFLLIGSVFYSNGQSKIQTIEIKTNTYCNHCKVCETCGQLMETELTYVKGIKLAIYNEESMTISVTYKSKKITPDVIRDEIAQLGYDADDVLANPVAYEGLDNCCKKK